MKILKGNSIVILLLKYCEVISLAKSINSNSKNHNTSFTEYNILKIKFNHSAELNSSEENASKNSKGFEPSLKNILRINRHENFPILQNDRINERNLSYGKDTMEITTARLLKKHIPFHVLEIHMQDSVDVLNDSISNHTKNSDINGSKIVMDSLPLDSTNAEYIFMNKSLINETKIKAKKPSCELGDTNCTRCRKISPYCHYMYSEARCAYYNAVHGSQRYECAERWYPIDKNEGFFVTIALLLVVTLVAIGAMVYLKAPTLLTRDDGEVEIVSDQVFAQMRSEVQRIRERRLPPERRQEDRRHSSI